MTGKILRLIGNLILAALVMIGLLSVLSIFSKSGRYRVFTVQSGSMEPAIHTGSLIFTKVQEKYQEGDIVTRKTRDDKVTVTHRIIRIEEEGFATKGDANDSEDGEIVKENQVVGKTYLIVPCLGYPVSYSQTSQGFIIVIVILAVLIIYEELKKIKKEIEKKIDYRRRVKKRKENKEKKKDEKENLEKN